MDRHGNAFTSAKAAASRRESWSTLFYFSLRSIMTCNPNFGLRTSSASNADNSLLSASGIGDKLKFLSMLVKMIFSSISANLELKDD